MPDNVNEIIFLVLSHMCGTHTLSCINCVIVKYPEQLEQLIIKIQFQPVLPSDVCLPCGIPIAKLCAMWQAQFANAHCKPCWNDVF